MNRTLDGHRRLKRDPPIGRKDERPAIPCVDYAAEELSDGNWDERSLSKFCLRHSFDKNQPEVSAIPNKNIVITIDAM